MRTFWFSYSLPDDMTLDSLEPSNSPYSLTWNVGRFLREQVAARGYDFQYVNLDDDTPREIDAEDVVLAHSWYPSGFLTMATESAAKHIFLLQPYQHDIVGRNESGWIKALAARCTHLFFVTGRSWWDTMDEGLYGDWKAKSTRLDMAVNAEAHPYSKRRWNAPGKRGVLAIGADIPYKGLDLIAELAQTTGIRLGYYGNAPLERFQHVAQFTHNGGALFTPSLIEAICEEYDFFISLARGDANPTTLLETACWGLVGACNKESGYWANQPFLELRLNDKVWNWKQMERLQSADEYDLRIRSERLREHVTQTYTWERFTATLWNKLEQWL